MSRLTAITGGIGSGKSVVCNVLRALGYEVYDCDLRARGIMDGDAALKNRLSEAFGKNIVGSDGSIDRPALGAIVFNDPEKLDILNALVHGAVKDDIAAWCDRLSAQPRLFIETAILYQSGLDKMVDDIWEVTAPEDVRIARVMARNNLTAEQVRSRIEAQRFPVPAQHPPVATILNDGHTPLLPQVLALLEKQN